MLDDGIGLVRRERERQKARWSAEHDDGHADGALAVAAACLALKGTDADVSHEDAARGDYFPWSIQRKGYSDLKRLAVAGALIAAEVDRLLRAEGKRAVSRRVQKLLDEEMN